MREKVIYRYTPVILNNYSHFMACVIKTSSNGFVLIPVHTTVSLLPDLIMMKFFQFLKTFGSWHSTHLQIFHVAGSCPNHYNLLRVASQEIRLHFGIALLKINQVKLVTWFNFIMYLPDLKESMLFYLLYHHLLVKFILYFNKIIGPGMQNSNFLWWQQSA